jgi:hypothetical protein
MCILSFALPRGVFVGIAKIGNGLKTQNFFSNFSEKALHESMQQLAETQICKAFHRKN